MKIKQITLFSYQLPLKEPLTIKDYPINVRQGIIICLTGEDSDQGFGEIAPLPGIHTENYEDVTDQLVTISHDLIHAKNIDTKNISDSVKKVNGSEYWYPSVRFGIESALIDLSKNYWPDPNPLIGYQPHHKNISINALVTGTDETLIKSVSQRLAENYRCIKLKVGRNTLEKDIENVIAVDNLIKQNATLRLDANRAWDFQTAVNFIEGIKNCTIEYIEEPLNQVSRLCDLYNQFNMPLALDESISDPHFNWKKSYSCINALVIKPSVIGSLSKTFELIRLCKKTGISAVISDTYQSGLGLSFLVWIASYLEENTAMGFDTYNYLADDILVDCHSITDATMQVDQTLMYAKKLDWSKLKEMYSIYE